MSALALLSGLIQFQGAVFEVRSNSPRSPLGNSYIATLVERHSCYVMLVKVANKDTESVVSALIKQSQRLLGEL